MFPPPPSIKPLRVKSDTQTEPKMGLDNSAPKSNSNVNASHRAAIKTVAEFKLRGGGRPIRQLDTTDMKKLKNDNPQNRVKRTQHQEPKAVALSPKSSLPPHLLMASLLEQLCHMYVRDGGKANQLFKILCERLSNLNVIAPLSHLDEMSSLRLQHRAMLNKIMKTAIKTLDQGKSLLALPPVNQDMRLSMEDDIIGQHTSRYRVEFNEQSLLGKGGFGSVFKAKHYLDGREYAVKKIRFKHKNTDLLFKLLREVKALANLQHSNIVGYNAAWMEYDSPYAPSGGSSSRESPRTQDTFSTSQDNQIYDRKDKSMSLSIDFCLSDDELEAAQKLSPREATDNLPGRLGFAMKAKLYSSVKVEELPPSESCDNFDISEIGLEKDCKDVREISDEAKWTVDNDKHKDLLQTNRKVIITEKISSSVDVNYSENKCESQIEEKVSVQVDEKVKIYQDKVDIRTHTRENIQEYSQFMKEKSHRNEETDNEISQKSKFCTQDQDTENQPPTSSIDEVFNTDIDTSLGFSLHADSSSDINEVCSENKDSDCCKIDSASHLLNIPKDANIKSDQVKAESFPNAIVKDMIQHPISKPTIDSQDGLRFTSLSESSCCKSVTQHNVVQSSCTSDTSVKRQNDSQVTSPSFQKQTLEMTAFSTEEGTDKNHLSLSSLCQNIPRMTSPETKDLALLNHRLKELAIPGVSNVMHSTNISQTVSIQDSNSVIFQQTITKEKSAFSSEFPSFSSGNFSTDLKRQSSYGGQRPTANLNLFDDSSSGSLSQSQFPSTTDASTNSHVVFGRKRHPSFKRSISCDAASEMGEVMEARNHNYDFQNSITLYIQMELCSHTLQEWLEERNSGFAVNENVERSSISAENMRIFHQVLEGVDFIHSHGLIHRDLKPRNIFLSGNDLHVKIGDFGLAKENLLSHGREDIVVASSPDDEVISPIYDSHTTGVGTASYASPEQLQGNVYGIKSDMYSLGVILFEMFHIFSTEMERVKELQQLRAESKCCAKFQEKWPLQANAVDALTKPDANERPSAKEMLSSQLFLSKDQQIRHLQSTILQLEAEKEMMKKQLTEKDKIIDKLRAGNVVPK